MMRLKTFFRHSNIPSARMFWPFCAVFFALCFPVVAQQPGKVPRIGVLMSGSPEARRAVLDAFRQGLRDFGYTEGKNIMIEYRFTEGRDDRLSELAAELVQLKVDIIMTSGIPPALAAKRATTTIPIVVAEASDLVSAGLVASLARPGGNITGTNSLTAELSGKRLELLKEVLPRLSRVGVAWNELNPGALGTWEETQAAASALQLQLLSLPIRDPNNFEAVFSTAVKGGAEALVVIQDTLTNVHRTRIAQLAARSRLPAVYGSTPFVEAGGLISYGSSITGNYRRAAYFVDKILKGAKPADLPVEQPTKFELVINLKAAKQIGVTISPNVLARADKVIR
jgi:putative tryptophan/tyrosine transport system substrate-binding protein